MAGRPGRGPGHRLLLPVPRRQRSRLPRRECRLRERRRLRRVRICGPGFGRLGPGPLPDAPFTRALGWAGPPWPASGSTFGWARLGGPPLARLRVEVRLGVGLVAAGRGGAGGAGLRGPGGRHGGLREGAMAACGRASRQSAGRRHGGPLAGAGGRHGGVRIPREAGQGVEGRCGRGHPARAHTRTAKVVTVGGEKGEGVGGEGRREPGGEKEGGRAEGRGSLDAGLEEGNENSARNGRARFYCGAEA